MADTIKVTVLRQRVIHDGLSMIVLKPGADDQRVPLDQVATLVEERAIEKPKGWKPAGARTAGEVPTADGAVFGAPPAPSEPVTTDMVRGLEEGAVEPIADEELDDASLQRLVATAVAEGVIADVDGMRESLIGAIRHKRSGGTFSDDEDDDLSQLDHDENGEPGGSKPHDPPSLTGKNKAELIAIAEAEGVEIEDGATNAAIVAAIETARTASAGDAGEGEGAPPA